MYGRECLETDVTEVRSCATSPMGGRNFNSRLIARGSLNFFFFFSLLFYSKTVFFLFVWLLCSLSMLSPDIKERETQTIRK